MKALCNLTKWDMKFQWKYGFYGLYSIFMVLYAFILFVIPKTEKSVVATILIFSDPAAMGLFFMGALWLLEKSQHIGQAISVSPINLSTYIKAKIFSLAFIGVLVSVVLMVVAGKENYVSMICGVFLSSCLFSLCGLMVAMKSDTVNQFMILTIPFEILIFIPAIFYFFNIIKSPLWLLHPGVAGILLIKSTTSYLEVLLYFAVLIIWCVVAFLLCKRVTVKAFRKLGGIA